MFLKFRECILKKVTLDAEEEAVVAEKFIQTTSKTKNRRRKLKLKFIRPLVEIIPHPKRTLTPQKKETD